VPNRQAFKHAAQSRPRNAATIRPVTSVEGTSRVVRVIGWPLTIVSISYLVLLGGAYPGVFAPSFRMVDVAIAGSALGLWLLLNFVDPRWRPATVLWPAFGAILVAFVISSITSALPRFSFEYVAYAIVLVALYLLLVRLQAHPFIGARLGSIAAILLAIIAVFYLSDTVALWQTWWSLVGRVTVPPLRPGFESLAFGNPSALGATSALLFVASAAHFGFGSLAGRVAVLILGFVTLVVCLVTGARSVWLGLAVMTVVVTILWLGSRGRREALAAALRTGRGRSALVAIVALGAAGAVVTGPGILVRMGFGDPYRPGFWLASLRMFRAAPLLGQGPGVWAAERATYTTPSDLDLYIPHGHNVYLQTLGELGLVGFLAAIVVVVVVGGLIRRSLSGTVEQRRNAWAAIAAIAYLAGHQLVDVVTNLPVVLFALALPISRLDALALAARDGHLVSPERGTPHGTWRRALVPIAMAAAAALAIGTLGWSTRIAVQHDDAVTAANAGDWDAALGLAQGVVAADQDMPPYHVTLGLTLARAGEADAAEQEFRRAAEVDDLPQAWLDIAALDVAAGRSEAARSALERALRLGRQQAAVALPATVLYVKLGDRDHAVEALTDALRAAPSIAGDRWWDGRSDLDDVRAAAIEQLISEGGATAFRIALETGQLDAAASALDTIAGDTTTLRLARSAWGGDAGARQQLEARAALQPLDLDTLVWNVVVADHVGDVIARDRFRAWADLVNNGAGTNSVAFRIVDQLTSSQAPAATLGLAYGQYLYLRPIPRDEVLAGLPKLVYP
jgi:O-antigen ligase/tetratricopeptide (TPR) repeat protein